MDALGVISTAIGGVSTIGGFVLYVIRAELKGDVTRLDGRINVNEALQRELKEDVAYIRQRIDAALNGRQV